MAGGDERFTVEGGDGSPVRLDLALAGRTRVGSRKAARRVLERGKVAVNGEPVGLDDAGRKLDPGTEIVIGWNRPGTTQQAVHGRRGLEHAGVDILLDDGVLVAVDKPAGLLTDAATGRQRRTEDSVRSRLDTWLKAQGDRAWPCHRIDRDTSGVVLFARSEEAAQAVRAQFAEHTPERVYLALVEGVPIDDQGTWTDWMAWDRDALRQEVVEPTRPGAVEASAHWRVLARYARAAWLEVRLHSGRRNQIRVHLSSRRMPLVGERQYRPLGCPPITKRLERQALHAHRLTLVHPSTGEPVAIDAPEPGDLRWMRRFLDTMG